MLNKRSITEEIKRGSIFVDNGLEQLEKKFYFSDVRGYDKGL